MGKTKRPKAALVKKIINPKKDTRIRTNNKTEDVEKKKKDAVKNAPKVPSHMFFQFNESLGPPYHVILDTNFINLSVRNKLDIVKSMMDCLYAKCFVYIPDAVIAELEKLGTKFRVALRAAKDPRFIRIPTEHEYADDCIVDIVQRSRCYIVATCDKDLKRRIRKIPGVPIMYITQHKYSIERLPDSAIGAPKL